MTQQVPRAFYEFLLTVDAPVQREQEFLLKAAGSFLKNEANSWVDLVGFDVKEAEEGASCFVSLSLYMLRVA